MYKCVYLWLATRTGRPVTSDDNPEQIFSLKRRHFLESADQAERLVWWDAFEEPERERLLKSLTVEDRRRLEVDRQRFFDSLPAEQRRKLEGNRERFLGDYAAGCQLQSSLSDADYMLLMQSLDFEDRRRRDDARRRFVDSLSLDEFVCLLADMKKKRKKIRELFEPDFQGERLTVADDAYFEELLRYAKTGVPSRPEINIKEELETFNRRLPELLAQHQGKYALIKGTDVEIRASYEDALAAGYKRFGLKVGFLVKPIIAAERATFSRDLNTSCATLAGGMSDPSH